MSAASTSFIKILLILTLFAFNSYSKKFQSLRIDNSKISPSKSWQIPSFEMSHNFTLQTWLFFGTQMPRNNLGIFARWPNFGIELIRGNVNWFNEPIPCASSKYSIKSWIHIILGYTPLTTKLSITDQNGTVCEKTPVYLWGSSSGVQLLRLPYDPIAVFHMRSFRLWFLSPFSLPSFFNNYLLPLSLPRSIRMNASLFFGIQRLGFSPLVRNDRRDGFYNNLKFTIPTTEMQLAGVDPPSTTLSVPTKPQEYDSLSASTLRNKEIYEYFAYQNNSWLRSDWYVPTREYQRSATIQGWVLITHRHDDNYYYNPLFGLSWTLFLYIRDYTSKLGCFTYDGRWYNYTHQGESNINISTSSNWQYVACINDVRHLAIMKDSTYQVLKNDIGFDINYYNRTPLFLVGPTNQNQWQWSRISFALREARYWQKAMSVDHLRQNRYKKLDGSKWGYLGLYYPMGQRQDGKIVDLSVNGMHLVKDGWVLTMDHFVVGTIYNVNRLNFCPYGKTRDFQNNNECLSGFALPRFTSSKTPFVRKSGLSGDLTYTIQQWVAPVELSMPYFVIWSFPQWYKCYVQNALESDATSRTTPKLRLQIPRDKILADIDAQKYVKSNKWFHISVGFQLQNNDLEVNLRIILNTDNVFDKTVTRVTNRTPLTAQKDTVYFGHQTDFNGSNFSHHYEGFFARIRIWKQYRSYDNIIKYMHSDARLDLSQSILKIYWKMDEFESRQFQDLSPNNSHLSIPSSDYYQFQIVPDTLTLCQGDSWYDGMKCRDDIWVYEQFWTSGSYFMTPSMTYHSSGHALSFWFFIDSGASTTYQILDDYQCSGGSGLYLTYQSNQFNGDVCGNSFSHRTAKPVDRWTLLLGSFFNSHADIFINTNQIVSMNTGQCCQSGRYTVLDKDHWGIYLRQFALYNSHKVKADVYRLFYGESPKKMHGLLAYYRLYQGFSRGTIIDQKGSHSFNDNKRSRDDYVVYAFDDSHRRICTTPGYRYSSSRQKCEPTKIFYVTSEYVKVLNHMGCMLSSMKSSIQNQRIAFDFWMNVEELGTNLLVVLGIYNSSTNQFSFGLSTQGYVVTIRNNSDLKHGRSMVATDLQGQWLHVVHQMVNSSYRLYVNGVNLLSQSITNASWYFHNNNDKVIKFGNSSNTGKFYLSHVTWSSCNCWKDANQIRQTATNPFRNKSQYSLTQSIHEFERPVYESNVVGIFYLDDIMTQTSQTYKMLVQKDDCYIFIHDHTYKQPPVYQAPDQQSLQEYPALAAGTSIDLDVPGNSSSGSCQFLFQMWLRYQSDLATGQKIEATLKNGSTSYMTIEIEQKTQFLRFNYNNGQVIELNRTKMPKSEWISVIVHRQSNSLVHLSVNDDQLLDKSYKVSSCASDHITSSGSTLHYQSAVKSGVAHFRVWKAPFSNYPLSKIRQMHRRVINGASYTRSLMAYYRLFRIYGDYGVFKQYTSNDPTDASKVVTLAPTTGPSDRSFIAPICPKGMMSTGTKCQPLRYYFSDRTNFNDHAYLAVQAETDSNYWDTTLEAWVSVTFDRDRGYFQDLFSCGTDYRRAMRVGLGNSGANNQIQVYIGSASPQTINHSVQYNQWTHYALSYNINSNASSGTAKMYVNGQLKQTWSKAVKIKCQTLNPLDFATTSSQRMMGYVTQFRFWGLQRSAAQITDAMNRRLKRQERVSLLAYYYLDGSDFRRNDQVQDHSNSQGWTTMGDRQTNTRVTRERNPDDGAVSWAPICEYYQTYNSKFNKCQDPYQSKTIQPEKELQVTLQTDNATVHMSLDLPLDQTANTNQQGYSITFWMRVVALQSTNTYKAIILSQQKKGVASPNGILISLAQSSNYNQIQFFSKYSVDNTKVLRGKIRQNLATGWQYVFINSDKRYSSVTIDSNKLGQFDHYIPIYHPQSKLIFGTWNGGGSQRACTTQFSEFRIWGEFKTQAQLNAQKFKLYQYSYTDIQALQLKLKVFLSLRNNQITDNARENVEGVLVPETGVDDAWKGAKFFTDQYQLNANTLIQKRMVEPLALKIASAPLSLDIPNLTASQVKKGITVKVWLRVVQFTSLKEKANVLQIGNLFNLSVQIDGAYQLIYNNSLLALSIREINRWNKVFISITKNDILLYINESGVSRKNQSAFETIIKAGVTSIASSLTIGSTDLAKIKLKQAIVLSRGRKFLKDQYLMSDKLDDPHILAFWRFLTEDKIVKQMVTKKAKADQDARKAAGTAGGQADVIVKELDVANTGSLSYEEDADIELCGPGIKRNSNNYCVYGSTNFALKTGKSLQIPLVKRTIVAVKKSGFTLSLMFNLLDSSALVANGSQFIKLETNFICKLTSSFNVKCQFGGVNAQAKTPDNVYTQDSWVHLTLMYQAKTKKFSIYINGVVQQQQMIVNNIPKIAEIKVTAIGDMLLKNVMLFSRTLPNGFVRTTVNKKIEPSKYFKSIQFYYPLNQGDGKQIWDLAVGLSLQGTYSWFSTLQTNQIEQLCPDEQFYNLNTSKCEEADKTLTFNKASNSGAKSGRLTPIKTTNISLPQASHSFAIWVMLNDCVETIAKFSDTFTLSVNHSELTYLPKGSRALKGTIKFGEWGHIALSYSAKKVILIYNGVQVDDPRGLQSQNLVTDGIIIGSSSDSTGFSNLDGSIGSMIAFSQYKQTSYYTQTMHQNPLFQHDDDSSIAAYWQPANQFMDWVSGQSVTLNPDSFIQNSLSLSFAQGEGLYNPDSKQYSGTRIMSFETASVQLKRTKQSFTIISWFLKRAAHDLEFKLSNPSNANDQFVVDLKSNRISAKIRYEQTQGKVNELALLNLINPSPAVSDDWVMLKISGQKSRKYEIVVNYINHNKGYQNTTKRDGLIIDKINLAQMSIKSTNITFEEMVVYNYNIPNQIITRDLKIHQLFPQAQSYYKFQESYGNQILDFSIYSDTNMLPTGIQWMASLPISRAFSFGQVSQFCPAGQFYDPALSSNNCVSECPIRTSASDYNICNELICLGTYKQQFKVCELTSSMTISSDNNLFVTLNDQATVQQDWKLFLNLNITGDRAPYKYSWQWMQSQIGSTASQFQIVLAVNNTLRGTQEVTVEIPKQFLKNKHGYSFSVPKVIHKGVLNIQPNPSMAQQISQSQNLVDFIKYLLGGALAVLIFLSLISKSTNLHNGWALIYSTQMFYLLTFINIQLPFNLEAFLKGFRLFIGQAQWMLDYIHPIKDSFQKKNIIDYPLNRHFELRGLKSTIFLTLFEQIFYIICGCFLLFILSLIISKTIMKSQTLMKVRCCIRFTQASHCNFWMRIIYTIFLSICFFGLISIDNINVNSGGFMTLMSAFNIISVIFVSLFTFVSIIVLHTSITKVNEGKLKWDKQRNFFLFQTDFKKNPHYSMSYFWVWLIHRILVCLLIVCAREYPLSQCVYIFFSSAAMAIYMVSAKPFKVFVSNVIEAIEGMFYAFSAIILAHIARVGKNETEQSLLFYGDLLIFVIILSIGVRSVFVAQDLVGAFIGLCSKQKSKLESEEDELSPVRKSLDVIEEDIFDEDEDEDVGKRAAKNNKKRRQMTVEEYFPGKIRNTQEPVNKKRKVVADLSSVFNEFSKIRREDSIISYKK